MNASTTARVVAAAALGTLAVVVPAAAAQAAPPSNGCPAPGYTSFTVAHLESVGPYQVPRLVDEQLGSHGREPNRNGSICGVPLGNKTVDGYQIYNFIDDSLPASS